MEKNAVRKNIPIVTLSISAIFLFIIPLISQAEDYDYYIDGSVSKSGDGSEEKPFKEINEAVKKGGSIFIENGKYDEDVEMEKGTKLFGESENGVIVSGKIIMEDDTKIQDITARGNRIVIRIKEDADAEIENCTIRDFGKIGINAASGGGELEVKDSKIQNGDGKGFYIKRGKKIKFLNNEVTDNDEEGIDIRSKVEGIIEGNIITKNGESGIELIVGSSKLSIRNNAIKRNGSSGIATQFYPERESKGQINIISNSLGNNKKYGLDCNRPQGGSPGSSYWKDSIELEENNIYANGLKSINDYCNLIDVVDEDEEVDNEISETENNETEFNEEENEVEPELTEEEKRKIEAEEKMEKEIKEQKLSEIESFLENCESFDVGADKVRQELKDENKIKVFFFGVNEKKIDIFNSSIENKERKLKQVQILMQEVDLEPEEEVSLQEMLDDARNIVSRQKQFIDNKKDAFSLLGWIRDLF